MKWLLSIILFLFFFAGFSQSTDLTQAADLFKTKKYTEALYIYQKILQEKGPGADLLYNIGLCELKLNQIANARLAFEKALLLDPNASAIKQGIVQVKSAIDPNIESLPPFILSKWFLSIRNLFNSYTWGWILLVLSFLIGGVGISYVFAKRVSKKSMLYLLIGLACYVLLNFSSQRVYEQKLHTVLMQSEPLRIAPDENGQVILPLGAGTKAQVKDSIQSWYKVLLENNDEGWLPKNVLSKI